MSPSTFHLTIRSSKSKKVHRVLWPILLIAVLKSISYENGIFCAAAPTTTEKNNTTDEVQPPGTAAALIVEGGVKINGTVPAVAAESARLLLLLDQEALADLHRVDNLTRQHTGDTFNAYDDPGCETDTCLRLSSGTAGLFVNDHIGTNKFRSNRGDDGVGCQCQCFSHVSTFREDLQVCVDDIQECTLAPFVSGSSAEKIPFVFLPLRGQIIHPSKEISFQGVKAPICAVSGAQYLTPAGWTELRNPIDTDVPFRLFRDEGRTFLQWLGEADLRPKMQGRLILVHLMCRDMTATSPRIGIKATSQLKSNQNIFSPCVAFRVVGTPMKYTTNVTEVLFQSETQTTASTETARITAKEYGAIAVCSLLLGLVYVASVFLYLHVKKRKIRIEEAAAMASAIGQLPMKNDQVTFGAGFSRSGSLSTYGSQLNAGSLMSGGSRRNSGRMLHSPTVSGGVGGGVDGNVEESNAGIVKNNPLLKHYPLGLGVGGGGGCGDGSGFSSSAGDLSNSNSECDDDMAIENATMLMKNMSNIMKHQQHHLKGSGQQQGGTDRNFGFDLSNSASQETECLPEENVSIVEDMTSEDKLENMKAIVNGTMRRKLYFNPAYFEPHLLITPPAAAIEFLSKIREVITIAKYKMSSKRYQPSLIMIPEEMGTDGNSCQHSVNNNSISMRPKSQAGGCAGCPGCVSSTSEAACKGANPNCTNCGDKRNSIRKWLEDIHDTCGGGQPQQQQQQQQQQLLRHSADPDNEHNILDQKVVVRKSSAATLEKKLSDGSSSDSDTIKANSIRSTKGKAPQPPSKLISNFYKNEMLANNENHNEVVDKLYAKNSINSLAEPQTKKIYEKLELYHQLTNVSGSQLFNNPQFNHNGSPQLSHRGGQPKHHHQAPHRSPIEVLDQFANPTNPNQSRHYEVMQNLHQMPDMVYEAIARDYSKQKFHDNNSPYGQLNLPTPDYDYESHHANKIYDEVPTYIHVPTPDYNTYGRSKGQPPPDSPIYTRKSPHHLIVDYETDSLERSACTKATSMRSPPPPPPPPAAAHQPLSCGGSDVSSQPSPSLSVALPLEEEVEVSNTVYDSVKGFRKDVPEIYAKRSSLELLYNKNVAVEKPTLPPKEPRIKYDTPYQGSMTIEVEHEPSDCELSTDSEQFEPDTLDRKPRKLSVANQKNSAAWSQHLNKSADFLNASDEAAISYSSLENMTSLPDMKYVQSAHNNNKSQLILRSRGSFKNSNRPDCDNFSNINNLLSDSNLKKSFNSLREIYEAKNKKGIVVDPTQLAVPLQSKLSANSLSAEAGRLLTLEARHSKRQRQTNNTTLKKPIPPDVIPSEMTKVMNFNQNIYDNPKTPVRAVERSTVGLITSRNEVKPKKNLTGWNTGDTKHDDYTTNDDDSDDDDDDPDETSSSASTEITGVSDTQINSEFESDTTRGRKFKGTMKNETDTIGRQYSKVQKQSRFASVRQDSGFIENDDHKPIEILENFMALGEIRNKLFIDQHHHLDNVSDKSNNSTLKSGSTKFQYTKNAPPQKDEKRNGPSVDDLDEIEVISSKSIPAQNDCIVDERAMDRSQSASLTMHELTGSTQHFELSAMARTLPTKVFRVDVNPSTHGMQIALGLKDRVKKSKDLKYAWKRFVNIATSKFSTPNPTHSKGGASSADSFDHLEKCSALSDGDDGISSMPDESISTTVFSTDPSKVAGRHILRTPSSASSNASNGGGGGGRRRCDPDGGYMSADSTESKMNSKKLYERFNFKSSKSPTTSAPTINSSVDQQHLDHDFAQKNMSRMQEIKESSELEKSAASSSAGGSAASSNNVTPTNSMSKQLHHQKPSVTGFIPKAFHLHGMMPTAAGSGLSASDLSMLQVQVYSSDDEERYQSAGGGAASSESDDEYNLDDMCESGAESVETNSVFFKNVRKLPPPPPPPSQK